MVLKKNINQFISYFFVGGLSALVEWICFFIFAVICNIQYMFATFLAFFFSTTVNFFLGKIICFNQSKRFKNNKIWEFFIIFFVSAIGLAINVMLMYFAVKILNFQSNILMTISKICATGIVFVWNFLIRKLFIYKV